MKYLMGKKKYEEEEKLIIDLYLKTGGRTTILRSPRGPSRRYLLHGDRPLSVPGERSLPKPHSASAAAGTCDTKENWVNNTTRCCH